MSLAKPASLDVASPPVVPTSTFVCRPDEAANDVQFELGLVPTRQQVTALATSPCSSGSELHDRDLVLTCSETVSANAGADKSEECGKGGFERQRHAKDQEKDEQDDARKSQHTSRIPFREFKDPEPQLLTSDNSTSFASKALKSAIRTTNRILNTVEKHPYKTAATALSLSSGTLVLPVLNSIGFSSLGPVAGISAPHLLLYLSITNDQEGSWVTHYQSVRGADAAFRFLQSAAMHGDKLPLLQTYVSGATTSVSAFNWWGRKKHADQSGAAGMCPCEQEVNIAWPTCPA